jgi:hypothetical protein
MRFRNSPQLRLFLLPAFANLLKIDAGSKRLFAQRP